MFHIPSPTRQGEKGGNFKSSMRFTEKNPFLYCLSSNILVNDEHLFNELVNCLYYLANGNLRKATTCVSYKLLRHAIQRQNYNFKPTLGYNCVATSSKKNRSKENKMTQQLWSDAFLRIFTHFCNLMSEGGFQTGAINRFGGPFANFILW